MPVLTERKQRRARNFGSLGCILKSQVMVEEQTRSEISPETQRRSLTALVVFLPICPRTSLSASCENIRRMNQHRLLHLHGMMMHGCESLIDPSPYVISMLRKDSGCFQTLTSVGFRPLGLSYLPLA